MTDEEKLKANQRHKAWRDRNPDHVRKYARDAARRLKSIVIEHYGSQCACCKESTPEFLTIDHVNGDGKAHREEIKVSGAPFFRWIIKNGFPETLRVLCQNCNFSRGRFGYCPHERERCEQEAAG